MHNSISKNKFSAHSTLRKIAIIGHHFTVNYQSLSLSQATQTAKQMRNKLRAEISCITEFRPKRRIQPKTWYLGFLLALVNACASKTVTEKIWLGLE